MMMPMYPGAPWLPKFSGTDDAGKYTDWKEQLQGMLFQHGPLALTEARRVAIVLGSLAGEAKRQLFVLDVADKDTAEKVFAYLDTLYAKKIPPAQLRAQFFSCSQLSNESIPAFILRLRELHCKLSRDDPDDIPSAGALRERLLLGLRECPLAQTLKVHALRNPTLTFYDLQQEALLLEEEYVPLPLEDATCSAVSNPPVPPKQDVSWRTTLKEEIMEDVKVQMKTLTQELMNIT